MLNQQIQDLGKANDLIDWLYIPDEEVAQNEWDEQVDVKSQGMTQNFDDNTIQTDQNGMNDVSSAKTVSQDVMWSWEWQENVVNDDGISEIISLIESASSGIEDAQKAVDDAQKAVDNAKDDNELSASLKELKLRLQEKDILLEELMMKNEILLKKMNEEVDKRMQNDIITREYKDVYEKVNWDSAIQRLVELASKRNVDDEARKKFANMLEDLYLSTTGKQMIAAESALRKSEKEAMSQWFWWDVPMWKPKIDENWLEDGLYIPDF